MSNSDTEWSLKEYEPPDSVERWFFRKNLAPNPGPQDSRFTHVAYVTIHFEPRDLSGLPNTEDEDLLFEMEDSGLSELESVGQAVHVASALKAGIKDLLFYTKNPEAFLAETKVFRKVHGTFAIECEMAEDPNWEHYAEFP